MVTGNQRQMVGRLSGQPAFAAGDRCQAGRRIGKNPVEPEQWPAGRKS